MIMGRAAAGLGLAGSVAHLATAGRHAGHSPVLAAGMVLLALVCLRCDLHLWRSPGSRDAWRSVVGLGAVMAALHLLSGMGAGPLGFALAVPAIQASLALADRRHGQTLEDPRGVRVQREPHPALPVGAVGAPGHGVPAEPRGDLRPGEGERQAGADGRAAA
jgi:hypothetical protein